MLATIRDDTWNVLNIQHITPNSKRWYYLDLSGGGHKKIKALHWRHNEPDGVSNHHPRDCLLNGFIQVQMKENIKAPRHWPLCGEFTGDRWILRTKDQ